MVESREALVDLVDEAASRGELIVTNLKDRLHLMHREERKVVVDYTCPRCGADGYIRHEGSWGEPHHYCESCGEIGYASSHLVHSGGHVETPLSSDEMRGGGHCEMPRSLDCRIDGWEGDRLVARTRIEGPENGRITDYRTPGGLDIFALT
jgi:hypothetical protein